MEQDYQYIFNFNFEKNCHWNKNIRKSKTLKVLPCQILCWASAVFPVLLEYKDDLRNEDKWEIHLGSTACAGAFVEHQHLYLNVSVM